MRTILKRIRFLISFFGIDPVIMIRNISGLPWFLKHLFLFKKLSKKTGLSPDLVLLRPVLNERNEKSGNWKGHYFHQDLLVAGKIFRNQPEKHVDIGSRIDGFIAHVASFREVEVFDIRPMEGTFIPLDGEANRTAMNRVGGYLSGKELGRRKSLTADEFFKSNK